LPDAKVSGIKCGERNGAPASGAGAEHSELDSSITIKSIVSISSSSISLSLSLTTTKRCYKLQTAQTKEMKI